MEQDLLQKHTLKYNYKNTRSITKTHAQIQRDISYYSVILQRDNSLSMPYRHSSTCACTFGTDAIFFGCFKINVNKMRKQ